MGIVRFNASGYPICTKCQI